MSEQEQHQGEELVSAYIGLKVTTETEVCLSDIAERVRELLEPKGIVFHSRKNNFHVTGKYYESISESNFAHEVQKSSQRLIDIHEKNNGGESNFKDTSLKFDESLHKSGIMKSNVDGKYYLVLKPHNNNSLLHELGMDGEVHLSIGNIENLNDSQIEECLKGLQQARDEVLTDGVTFLLDWSKIYSKIHKRRV